MGNAMFALASENASLGFSRSGQFYCFEPHTGQLKWQKNVGDFGISKENACLWRIKSYLKGGILSIAIVSKMRQDVENRIQVLQFRWAELFSIRNSGMCNGP